MFSKSAFFTTIFVFLGFALRFADATPPACLLACVNEHEEVANFEEICDKEVAKTVTCLKRACDPEVYQTALESYKSTCKTEGITVVVPVLTASSSTTTAAATKTHASKTPSAEPTETKTSTSDSDSGSDGTKNSTNVKDDDKDDSDSASSTVYFNSLLALVAVFAAAVAL